jgi:hypothetical protein
MSFQVAEDAINDDSDHYNGDGESDAGEDNRSNVGVPTLMANRTSQQQAPL